MTIRTESQRDVFKSLRKQRVFLPIQQLAILLVLILGWSAAIARGQEKAIDFAHDILPVLKSRCAECHANGVYKGGLSLETREKMLDSGTVETGDSSSSDLIDRIVSSDLDERMPPEGEPLTAEQVAKFKAWIDQGAKWPEELSLKKPTFKRPLQLRKVELPSADIHDHPIDRLMHEYFRSNSITPPSSLTRRNFLRRAKLDLLGQLPTQEDILQFTHVETARGDEMFTSEKRDQMVDDLLSRDVEYANHWLSFWNDLLRNDYVGTGYIDGGRKQITGWLYQSLLENKPYDQFVRELIHPTGESEGFIKGIKWRGRVNASQVEPLQFSQNVSQVFLGINMKCASCHDSFIDDWKLEDAYGLAAIASEKPLEMHRCDVPTGTIAKSKFVFSGIGQIDHSLKREQRLAKLAELITSEKNGRLPRTIVNRIWHRLMGRGLVHPVDVMSNEAWSETILDYLAADLVENGYDLKRTIRLIATSKIYASQSVAVDPYSSEAYVFRGVESKRLTAEQFIDAIWALTDAGPTHTDAKVSSGVEGEPTGKWIWKDKNSIQAPAGETLRFRYEFELEELPISARSVTSCDNEFTMFINGKKVSSGTEWTRPGVGNLLSRLVKGNNVVLIRASNAGDSPNPAALFSEIVIKHNDGSSKRIATDETWQWTSAKTDSYGKQKNRKVDWKAAAEATNAESIYERALPAIRLAIGMHEQQGSMNVRASLVKSDALMRSLGRPNREQVVTTRPAELSTLQALDLSNGAILTGWLQTGAQRWVERQQQQSWSNEQLVNQIFADALTRSPTLEEFQLVELQDDLEKQPQVEDLLWMITSLPEFQFVR